MFGRLSWVNFTKTRARGRHSRSTLTDVIRWVGGNLQPRDNRVSKAQRIAVTGLKGGGLWGSGQTRPHTSTRQVRTRLNDKGLDERPRTFTEGLTLLCKLLMPTVGCNVVGL